MVVWKFVLPVLILPPLLCAVEVPNLSGTWKLDVAKSTWGKKPKPQSVTLTLEHHEPALRYSGTVISGTAEEDTHRFVFEGAIDGKEYSAGTQYGPGYTSFKRINPYTILETTRSGDGRFVETTRNSVSPDGRIMTRRIVLKSPDGRSTWTEVYEKE